MGKNKKDKHEDLITMVPGASAIDIGEIRRAQLNQDADLSDDEEFTGELSEGLSLDDEAKSIMEELANDLELKIDVLAGYEETESNQDLDKIAERVAIQTATDIAGYEKLSLEVSDELALHNLDLIKEDILLENSVALELAAETVAPAPKQKLKKAKREKATDKSADESLDMDALDSDLSMASASDLTNDDEAVEIEEMSEQDLELKAALPQLDENGNYLEDDLQSCISALLFYSDKPLSLKKIKDMLEMPDAEDTILLRAINALKDEFTKLAHGFEIADIAGGYQLRTKIARAPLLRKLAKVQIQRLSRGAMETLTIVAFKQPCTKDDIDQVRGVDSSHFIRTLLDRSLIEVSGRSEAAGRPMIYNTTNTFLEIFGMMDLTGLPSLHEIEAMVPQLAAIEEGAEDPRIVQMRKMVHQMKADSNHLDYNAKEDDQILADIRERVKSIDVTTPYLARQKALAAEGIHGADAEDILAKEFGFARDSHTGIALDANPHVEHTDSGELLIEAGDMMEKPAILHQANLDLNQEHTITTTELTDSEHEPLLDDAALLSAREALENIDLDDLGDEHHS